MLALDGLNLDSFPQKIRRDLISNLKTFGSCGKKVIKTPWQKVEVQVSFIVFLTGLILLFIF